LQLMFSTWQPLKHYFTIFPNFNISVRISRYKPLKTKVRIVNWTWYSKKVTFNEHFWKALYCSKNMN
jgi:hypothetical protein